MYSAPAFGFLDAMRRNPFNASRPRFWRPYFFRSRGCTSTPASGPSNRAVPSTASP